MNVQFDTPADRHARAEARRDERVAAIRRQLDVQGWMCCYPCGKPIEPGDQIARAFDGNGIAHLDCTGIGAAPARREENQR